MTDDKKTMQDVAKAARKRNGTKAVWAPPKEAGAIVAMEQYRGEILIACEFALFRFRGNDISPITE